MDNKRNEWQRGSIRRRDETQLNRLKTRVVRKSKTEKTSDSPELIAEFALPARVSGYRYRATHRCVSSRPAAFITRGASRINGSPPPLVVELLAVAVHAQTRPFPRA